MTVERMYPTQHILRLGGDVINAEICRDEISIIWRFERKCFVRIFKNLKMTEKEFINTVYGAHNGFNKKEV